MGIAPTACGDQIVEVADNYRLHFVEFDDQGRPYSDKIEEFGEAHRQIEALFDGVEDALAGSPGGASVVVFAHGWLHSAKNTDSNLQRFRELLAQLYEVERAAVCKREIVGLYVGWRGAGTRLAQHPYDTLTFWSRKFAAEQVATGSIQEVLARLKALQSVTPQRVALAQGPGEPDCSSRLKTTYVGHSFGGLIMMSATSQDVIRRLMLDSYHVQRRSEEFTGRSEQPDEMVVVINPAIEGARFDALFRVAGSLDYPTYRSPRFVAITSRNDWATGILFPVGRTLNTLTKRYPNGDNGGRSAARKAVGHDPQYLTRSLTDASAYSGKSPVDMQTCDAWQGETDFTKRAQLDVTRARALHASVGGEYDANANGEWPRLFCVVHRAGAEGDTGVLVMDNLQEGRNRNVPVWNVQTEKPIVREHGDINNPRLIEFLRQLYVDSMFFRGSSGTIVPPSQNAAP